MKPTSDLILQLVEAGARNAGHNYIENLSVRNVRDFMRLMEDAECDAKAKDSEGFFKARFRFSVAPEERSEVIRILRQGKLTDDQIIYMRRTGVLDIKDKVALRPSYIVEAVGVLAALLAFVLGLVALFAEPYGLPSLVVLGKQMCLTFSFFGMLGLSLYTFVGPHRLARRARGRMASAEAKTRTQAEEEQ